MPAAGVAYAEASLQCLMALPYTLVVIQETLAILEFKSLGTAIKLSG